MEAAKNGKFLSDDGRKEAQAASEKAQFDLRLTKVRAVAGLVLGDALLVYMIMGGKIDTLFGVLFLAAASAFFGRMTK